VVSRRAEVIFHRDLSENEHKRTYQKHCSAFEEDNVVEMLEDNLNPTLSDRFVLDVALVS
jgi:hypothetical protein